MDTRNRSYALVDRIYKDIGRHIRIRNKEEQEETSIILQNMLDMAKILLNEYSGKPNTKKRKYKKKDKKVVKDVNGVKAEVVQPE